jgi:putative ubiquitin-RnfH superfamily antitoxin RatB of RatAB toxin-antitoxin module
VVSGQTRLKIEVVYALREEQTLIALEVEAGATVRQAIESSGILARFPDIELTRGNVGVFGSRVELNARLRDGDRVEIYRPLIADPKQARRERANRRK